MATSLAVLFHEIGGPDVLEIEDVTLGEPGAGELRIRVDAIGLNRAESWFRAGAYYVQPPLPGARIGYEASGVVEAVGPDVTGFAPGDPVSTVPGFHPSDYGVYGDGAIVPASATLHRPEPMDAVTGAAVWTSFVTSYGALVDVGRVRAGDTVLITAASSSVGLAAIQVANHLGAIPIATTRTSAKRQRLCDAGAADVIATGEEDLLERVSARTSGRGVAMAFDAVGGPGMSEVAQAVTPGGTLISYGFQGGFPGFLPFPAYPFALNIRVYSIFEVTRDQRRLRRAEHFVKAGLRSGAFAPTIDRVFELTGIVEAHRYMEAGTQVGKIVVTVPR